MIAGMLLFIGFFFILNVFKVSEHYGGRSDRQAIPTECSLSIIKSVVLSSSTT